MDSGMYQPIPEGFWAFMDVEIERRLGKLTDEEARVETLSKIRQHFENEAPLRAPAPKKRSLPALKPATAPKP